MNRGILVLALLMFLMPWKGPLAAQTTGNFMISPAKVEVNLNPGEEITKNLTIINQTGREINFKLTKEDFEGTTDLEKVTRFLGEEKGRFSLKEWLLPTIDNFVLRSGEQIEIPIKIAVPPEAEPGGYYAAIFVASQPRPDGTIKAVSRLGSLFFVRINGQAKEEGFLSEFKADKFYFQKGLVRFNLLSQNTGNVHLIPYGIIEIRDIFGRKKNEIGLEPWFVMPDSPRLKQVSWQDNSAWGLYTATAKINRGYQNIVDQKSVKFLVVPNRVILIGLTCLVGLVILGIFLWQVFSKKR